MTDASDNKKLRDLFKYQLRSHVSHQDGRDSLAPSLVFADADYEVGDGTCGLHSDAKSANEPAIVFVRADSLIDALAEHDHYKARAERAEKALKGMLNHVQDEVFAKWRPRQPTVQEAARMLLGGFESPLLVALDPFNNSVDVAEDVLAALRAIAEGDSQ